MSSAAVVIGALRVNDIKSDLKDPGYSGFSYFSFETQTVYCYGHVITTYIVHLGFLYQS